MNNVTEFADRVGTEVPESNSKVVAEEYEDEDKFPIDLTSQGKDGDRAWASSDEKFWSVSGSYDSMPAGVYRPRQSQQGFYLEKAVLAVDDLMNFPDSASINVIKEIERFWTMKERFTSHGFIHKRGILMWGDPGSGKTATIQLILKSHVDRGGLVLLADLPYNTTACMQMIRRVEPNRELLVIMEDLESLVQRYEDAEFLAMLDGESQVDNVVFLATTNYPERLDKRFVDRPSRFDTVVLVPFPSEAARRHYFVNKLPDLSEEDVKKWVKLSSGFGVAHLKEMVVSYICFDNSIEDIAERLRSMTKREFNSDDALNDQPSRAKTVGFAPVGKYSP